MLTQNDLRALKNLIGLVIDEKDLVTRGDLSFLPTKDQFYEEMEKIYKKLDNMELEKNVLVARTADSSKRLDLLEEIHPEGRRHAV